MTKCSSDEATRVNATMNDVYKTLIARVAEDKDAVTKIKAAQDTWLTYRSAFIEAMYPAKDKQAEYGSKYTMDVNTWTWKLTQRHIAELRDLLQEHGR